MMIKRYLLLVLILSSLPLLSIANTYTFTNDKGETLEGKIIKYDDIAQLLTIEVGLSYEKIPLNSLSKKDQEYIIKWNIVNGFEGMRFKTSLTKKNWGRMRWNRTAPAYWMETVAIDEKSIPSHNLISVDGFEENESIKLRALGYEITLKNQNTFPLEGLTVQHKIFYTKEKFSIGEDITNTYGKEYEDTIVTSKFKEETITLPSIAPQETITIPSKCVILSDAKISKSDITEDEAADGGEEGGGGDGGDSETELTIGIDGFDDFEDSSRRRRDRIAGIWVRIGIQAPDGEMVWRELIDPQSLSKVVTWDGEITNEDLLDIVDVETNALPRAVEQLEKDNLTSTNNIPPDQEL